MLSLQELTNIIKNTFDDHVSDYYTVKGEVINCSDKGHIWFALRDGKCKMNSVVWKATKERENISFETGDVIQATGKIRLYEPNNSYSFNVTKVKTLKSVETAFQKNYKHFKTLGYFDKKNIVDNLEIKTVGLITSMKGEARSDFMKTLRGRFFPGKVFIMDSNVQGVKCCNDVVTALNKFEKRGVDVILITRGGGSSMDLDEFNNPKMIEAIYKCKIPVYTGIGHEADKSLSDYVADLSTSTPTSLALEISVDMAKLTNVMNKFLNKNKEIYHSAKTKLTMKINDQKNKLYKEIVSNKPSGFYIGKKFINNLADFQKLSKQKFVINLEDGVIEFDIKDYKVIKQKDTTYSYGNYIELFNEVESVNHENLSGLITSLSKETFGTKKHFETLETILETIEYYNSNIIALDTIKEIEKNFDLTIEETDDLEQTFNNIKNYTSHLNYLTELKDNNFKGIKCNKLDLTSEDLYKIYSTYKSDTMTEELINLYLNIKKIKPKFLQIKRS